MVSYLGVDLGTQSLKALLVDGGGRILASAAAPIPMVPNLAPGHSEQEPHSWLTALRRAVAEVVRQAPEGVRALRAMGVSGQQHGLVALDAARHVLRPAKLWNDVSCAGECAAILAEAGGPDRWFHWTGNHLPPGFTAGKVRWLRGHEPERFARIAHVLLPHDYLNFQLSGQLAMEDGDASGTGVYDVRARAFSHHAVAAVAPELERWLPPLVPAGDPVGRLRADIAGELGLPAGIAISTGGGDNMMAAIGCGAVEPGIAILSLGTSGTVFACADEPVCDPAGEVAAFCDSTGRWLPLGCTMNATQSTELARELVAVPLERLDAVAGAAPAGSAGLLCVPFFTGERSPDLPQATGAWLGVRPDNASPGHLLRATMEGATYALVRLLHRLTGLGVPLRELRLTGGGSHSRLWCRIVAAATGRAVTVGMHADAAALGAAVHAAWTERRQRERGLRIVEVVRELGVERDLRELAPDPEWSAVYEERKAAYRAAVETLTPLFPRLRPQ
ncbi:MAG: xylulokinase [Planctomycetes bacterium]|nr:xylulokinase [Planctomycetota bacterium]